jgi:hypothetical protein
MVPANCSRSTAVESAASFAENSQEIEQLLIKESKRADYRLADYLDLAWSAGPRTQAHMSVRATAPEL